MRRLGKIVAVNGALVFGVLVAAELIFGSWIWGPAYSVLNIPRNTVRHFDVSQLYARDGPVIYTRDRHGLRGPYPRPDAIDILVMGGSTTDEINVSDGETWVDQLRQAFAEAGRPLVIVNAAIDGQSILGHLRAIDLWFPNIPSLRTRYVLVYVGINDTAMDDPGRAQYDAMASPDPLRRLRGYLMNNSVFYNRFRQLRGGFAAKRMRLVHGARRTMQMEWQPVTNFVDDSALVRAIEPELEAYAGRLRALARKIRGEMIAEPVFVTQKRSDYKFGGGRLWTHTEKGAAPPSDGIFRMLTHFNRATLRVCAELELLCVDLAGDIAFEDGDFYDAIHTTPAGSRRIGRFLHQRLERAIR